MKLLTFSTIIIILITSCQSNLQTEPLVEEKTIEQFSPPVLNYDQEIADEEGLENTKTEVIDNVYTSITPIQKQKIIRHATIRMQVKDYVASSKVLKNYIKKQNAYIASEEESRDTDKLNNTLQIRVNNVLFDLLLQDLVKESIYLEEKNIIANDVTEEFIDTEARLKTKKMVEARYLNLLAKAVNVKEILAVETELKSIREEIEATEARNRYLQHQVAFSTINLVYFQTITPLPSPDSTFAALTINSIKEGWKILISFFLEVIRLWPLWLILTLIIVGVKRLIKKRRAVTYPTI